MGALLSKKDVRGKEIEKQIKEDKKELAREVKLLLLGPGESGKSTLTKQMKLIHLSGFSNAERMQFRDIVHQNVVAIIKSLVTASRNFGYKFDKATEKLARRVDELDSAAELSEELGGLIRTLWGDSNIQKAYVRYAEYQLSVAAKYYMDNIDRVTSSDYLPTDEDILRVRAKTTGITEMVFEYSEVKFRLVDVGGQRSERKKWIHCFDDVSALLFVVAISEYDLMLYEDQSVRRMDESMTLFKEIANSAIFQKTPIILLLNKADLFREKLARLPLNTCFPDYDGENHFDEASRFIERKFLDLNAHPQRQIYTHITTATDTQNIQFVFDAIKDILLTQVIGSI